MAAATAPEPASSLVPIDFFRFLLLTLAGVSVPTAEAADLDGKPTHIQAGISSCGASGAATSSSVQLSWCIRVRLERFERAELFRPPPFRIGLPSSLRQGGDPLRRLAIRGRHS